MVVFACVGDDEAPRAGRGTGSRTSTGSRPRPSAATWWPARPTRAPRGLHRYAEAGARHIVVMVAGSPAVEHFAPAAGRLRRPRTRDPGGIAGMSGHRRTSPSSGTGMTDMSRRDLAPETMAYQAVHEALGDAGLAPTTLGLVIVGNAMAGRLSDQGCVRGQTWLRKAGLSEAAIINVDNSCAGGSSALHLATMAAARPGPAGPRPRRREDVDRQPRRDDRRDRGRPARRVPPRPARSAPRRRQPGRAAS